MMFLATFAVTCLCVVVLRSAIRAYPVLFYALCLVFDIVLVALAAGVLPHRAMFLAIPLLRRGFIAIALFVIVMYIGVFPYGSAVRNYLAPIRAVLSICACILALGHIAMYFTAYMTKLFAGVLSAPLAAAMVAGLALLCLLLLLGVTSFRAVRRRLGGRAWLNLQKLAYLFYALIYVHAACVLLPPALSSEQGGHAARVSIAIYTVVFGVYAVARIVRAAIDRRDAIAHEKRQQELDTQSV